ncbi:MAG: hypothetical protein ACXIT4_11770 [Erythrobacter sp.]
MDLNELLYAHQLAVINANAPHASLDGRAGHLEEASGYANTVVMMPGSLDIRGTVIWSDAPIQPLNCRDKDQNPLPQTSRSAAALSVWESEGGATGSP